jgi:hypothetical protein
MSRRQDQKAKVNKYYLLAQEEEMWSQSSSKFSMGNQLEWQEKLRYLSEEGFKVSYELYLILENKWAVLRNDTLCHM